MEMKESVQKVEKEKKGWLGKLFGGKKKEEGSKGTENKEEAPKEEPKT